MIPARFVVEYPLRCLELLQALEPTARKRKLLASFSLLAASGIFTIPYSRLKEHSHPLGEPPRCRSLYDALRIINKQKFLGAEFWRETQPGPWRFSRIVSRPNSTINWRDERGLHPMRADAQNMIGTCKVREVLWVIRNALAHGNIVYLDESGNESWGAEVRYLAFLTRHEELRAPPPKSYDLVTATEESFLDFVKSWANWLGRFPPDDRLIFREAAD
jgi:hypothetical protein